MFLARLGHKGPAGTAARLAFLLLLAALLLGATGVCAAPAQARGSVKTLINDASDGFVDGTYSIATVQAALSVVRNDPSYMQYSDIEGVLADYLASLTKPKSPSAKPTPTASSTPKPSATKTAKAHAKKKKHHTASPSPADSPSVTASAPTPSPSSSAAVPAVSGWSRAKTRLAATPWFFAIVGVVVVGGVVLVRRRRSA